MRFDYFYGSQAEQFSFIRIPRILIKDPRFSPLSVYAKMLYSPVSIRKNAVRGPSRPDVTVIKEWMV